MGPNMCLQVARLGKCFIAFFAYIMFHPSMNLNVPLQVARLGECLITFLAFM